MIENILCWIAIIIFVEALVEIIIEAEVLFKIRNILVKFDPSFLGKLVSCGYCMSVWIAATIAWTLPGNILITNSLISIIINAAIKTFIIHRLSNIWHELISRWNKRLPWNIVFTHEILRANQSSDDEGVEIE